jgi:uncharacterized DUF497 family protein
MTDPLRGVRASFEWDEVKNGINKQKHGISFEEAQTAFLDTHRVIARDADHSSTEERFFCIGRADEGILTVRFTMRERTIRILGAGYRRKGKQLYEKENNIQR